MWRSACVTIVIFTTVLCSEEDLLRIDSIVQEAPCRRAGGICTVAGDCPGGQLSEKTGLCPQQREQGIECCYGVSQKETRCIKHGGECMPPPRFCNPMLIFSGAQDCPDTHKCCIMTL